MGPTVSSIFGGYSATESSRDTSCCLGSYKNSGITGCVGHSGLKLQSANTLACGLKRTVHGCGRRLGESEFRLFSRTRRKRRKEKKPLFAGKIFPREEESQVKTSRLSMSLQTQYFLRYPNFVPVFFSFVRSNKILNENLCGYC